MYVFTAAATIRRITSIILIHSSYIQQSDCSPARTNFTD